MNTAQQLGLAVAIVVGIFLYIQLLCVLIATWSGWRKLAEGFRHEFDFRTQIGGWQSARMRWGCNYNNAIKVGTDSIGLYLCTVIIVPQHPSLLIPWNEIRVVRRSKFLAWTFIHLELGSDEQIPFAIRESLFTQINRENRLDASNIW